MRFVNWRPNAPNWARSCQGCWAAISPQKCMSWFIMFPNLQEGGGRLASFEKKVWRQSTMKWTGSTGWCPAWEGRRRGWPCVWGVWRCVRLRRQEVWQLQCPESSKPDHLSQHDLNYNNLLKLDFALRSTSWINLILLVLNQNSNLGRILLLQLSDLSFHWRAREACTQWILRARTHGRCSRSTLMVLDQNLNLGWGLLLAFFDLSFHWGAGEACTQWILRARTQEGVGGQSWWLWIRNQIWDGVCFWIFRMRAFLYTKKVLNAISHWTAWIL